MDLGDYLRIERKRRRLTQAQFAKEIGVSVRTYGPIERGKSPTVDICALIDDEMEWEDGLGVDNIRKGLPPVPKDDPGLDEIKAGWRSWAPADRRRFLALFRWFARWLPPG